MIYAILDENPGTELVVHLDRNLKITHINCTPQCNGEIDFDGLIGKSWHEAVPSCEPDSTDCPVLSSIRNYKVTSGVFRGPNSQIATVRCYPLPDENGDTSGAVVTISSSTGIGSPLDEGLASDEFYRDYPDGLALIDPVTERFIDLNETLCSQHGYTRQEMFELPVYYHEPIRGKHIFEEIVQALQIKGSHTEVINIRTKQGETKNLRIHFGLLELDGKQLIRCVTHDISDLKATENRLLKSESQYRSLVEASPDIIMEIDLSGTILYVNRILKGTRPEDAIGTNFLDYMPAVEHTRVRKLLYRAHTRDRNTEFEVSIVTPVGTRWWQTRALPQERDGIVNRFLIITTDITETKRAQDALKLSEERYRSLVEKSPLPITVQRYGFLKYANPKALQLLGLVNADKLPGKHIKDFIHPDERERINRLLPTNYNLEEPPRVFEFRLQRSNGEIRDISASAIIINYEGELSRMLMMDDITERRQALLDLQQSEERYRNLVESAPLPAIVHCDGLLKYANPAAVQLAGADSLDDIIDTPITDFIHPDDRQRIADNMVRFYSTDESAEFVESKLTRKNGETRNIIISAQTIVFEGEKARLAMFQDITDLKNAEAALRASEEKYRYLTETMRDAVFLLDLNFNHKYISPSITKIRGFSTQEIFELPIEYSLPPESLEQAQRFLAQALAADCRDENGEPLVFQFEQQEWCKDGSKVWTEVVASFTFGENGNPDGIIGCTRDITDRKARESIITAQQGNIEQIIEMNPLPILIIDKNGRYQSSNRAFFELNGNLPDKDFNFFESTIVKEPVYQGLFNKVKSGETVRFPVMEINPSRINPEGRDITLYVEIAAFPVWNPGGEIEFYVFMYNDRTESRHAEMELKLAEERYRKIVENIPLCVIIYSGDVITYANRSVGNLIKGDPSADLKGVNLIDLIFEDDRELVAEKMKKPKTDPDVVQHSRHRMNTVNGVKWIEGTGITIEVSKQPRRMLFFREIDPPNDSVS